MLSGRVHVGVGTGAEGQVAGHEPHGVVAADALGRLAALVDAVGHEQPRAEVADRHLGDVLHHHVGQVRELDVGQDPPLGLDLPGDGEHVPEGPADTVGEEEAVLVQVGDPGPGEQRGVGVEELASPGAQRSGPGVDGLRAPQGAGRLVGAVGQEAAVEALALDHLGGRVVVLAEELVGGVRELGHGHLQGRRRPYRPSPRPRGVGRAHLPALVGAVDEEDVAGGTGGELGSELLADVGVEGGRRPRGDRAHGAAGAGGGHVDDRGRLGVDVGDRHGGAALGVVGARVVGAGRGGRPSGRRRLRGGRAGRRCRRRGAGRRGGGRERWSRWAAPPAGVSMLPVEPTGRLNRAPVVMSVRTNTSMTVVDGCTTVTLVTEKSAHFSPV